MNFHFCGIIKKIKSKEFIFYDRKLSSFYRETVRIINGYMNKNHLNFELQSKVRRYLEYKMKNESNIEGEKLILGKLTQNIRNEVVLEACGQHIRDLPFFKNNFSKGVLENMILSLTEISLSPEETLYYVKFYDDDFNFLGVGIFFRALTNFVIGGQI